MGKDLLGLGAVPDKEPKDLLGLGKPKDSVTLRQYGKKHGYEYTPRTLSDAEKAKTVRSLLETGGALAGGAIAAPANILAPGIAEILGVGGGYIAGKKTADIYEQFLGMQKPPTIGQEAKTLVQEDIPVGILIGMTGPAAQKIIKGLGSTVKSVWGALTGTGKAAIDEAVKSGLQTGITKHPLKSLTAFDKALRKEISGQEVVEHTKDALAYIKEIRGMEYRGQLAQLTQNKSPIGLTGLRRSFDDLLKQYVRVDAKGNPDWSRSALGTKDSEGVKKIKEIAGIIKNWGFKKVKDKEGKIQLIINPEDYTAQGLDMLKRQLDDFWSESSHARALVASMRNKVKDLIIRNVPEYKEMMKNYEQATTLIKDIESGLMMRKQGISGRIVADQTLRRLMSAMKDNFILRYDLLEALGGKSGKDLTGEVAGHVMSSVIPRGLQGTGPSLIGQAALAKYVSPKFWPVLAASSPRVSAEFLRLYGKFLAETSGLSPMIGRGVGVLMKDSRANQPSKPQ